MYKFIKDEIELITAGRNDATGLVTFAGIYGLMTYMVYMLYQSLIYLFTPASSYPYSFSRDSLCAAPPSAEVVLFGLFGLLLICSGILAMIEHYENEDNINKTSK